MRSPTIILMIVVLMLFASACSSDTEVRYIAANVISRPSVSDEAPPSQDDLMEDVSVDTEQNRNDPLVATVTKSEDEIIGSMTCDEDRINLGYKLCYNTSEGKVKIYLKNSGYDDIVSLWFNIEVDEKPHYESSNVGLYGDEFVEYVLDLPEWQRKYGNTDRIIIVPLRMTSEGKKACPNRALLLEPLTSCTKYEYGA